VNRLILQGLCGGVGTTAVLCGLALALHEQGERVLLIDGSPHDLARLHFGDELANITGWARAHLDGTAWNEALEVRPGLQVLPYGRLAKAEIRQIDRLMAQQPEFWPTRCTQLRPYHDWVLFDLPSISGDSHAARTEHDGVDLLIDVATPTPACHAVLHRAADRQPDLMLINRFNPASQLQRDLVLLWRVAYSPAQAPQIIHEDEAVAEALAHKLPVGLYAPHSQAAGDLRNLALWCLARKKAGARHA